MADFPLLNEASLVMIPGATKEGKVYSQVPTDGSGDFTFTRSTSATRVNEAGNIEKGYENLLLQSNTFNSSSDWNNERLTITTGYEGYDGSNDAWKLVPDATDSTHRINQSTSLSGVKTFSIYAKAAGYDYIRVMGFLGNTTSWTFDLKSGSTVSAPNSSYTIDYGFENVGNDWYRLTITSNEQHTNWYVFVYDNPQQATFSGNGTDGIYIQDAQLNQGLVAYPYLETTTAPVYGGLQADQPRLDYTDATCPSLLLEPSRTNLVPVAEYGYITANANLAYNDETSPEGVENGLKVTALATNTAFIRTNSITTTAESTFSAFVKYGNNPWLSIINSGNSNNFFNFNCQTGEFGTNGAAVSNLNAEDYGNGWWRLSATFGHIGLGTTRIYLSNSSSAGFGNAGTTVGNYFYNYGWQYEAGSYPTSYIPTYGSAQTRAAETTTSTFNSSSTGTISVSLGKVLESYFTVLGESFEANATRNDIAIAYSPTALKVSLNGAIVVNATGTYDTSSLSSLQLGHDNGSDQLGGGVENLIMFNDFLTDTELNAITV